MIEQSDHIAKVTDISHEKLLPVPKKSVVMFHIIPILNLRYIWKMLQHPKKQKHRDFKQNYDDIISKCSSDIELTHLEKMRIETDLALPSVASKPYHLPIKHHIFVKKEIENFLEARLIG